MENKQIEYNNKFSEEDIFSEYQQIWKKYKGGRFSDVLQRGFEFQYDEDETECEILFIGINPAFTKGNEGDFSNPREKLIYPYFKPFRDITNTIDKSLGKRIKWTHLDLLVFKETEQA
jgi:hypothetical protein